MNPVVSIVVVTFNQRAVVEQCLAAIRSTTPPIAIETIVVDNASTDGTPDMIERDFPDFTLVRNSENRRFAIANNQALRMARGRWILLLNSDCILQRDSLRGLVDFAEAGNGRFFCVGPRVLNADGSFQSEGHQLGGVWNAVCQNTGLLFWPLPAALKRFLLPRGFDRVARGRVRRVGWVSGCCMLLDADKLKRLGGLDESIFFYGEEVELCYRAARQGLETWVLPMAAVLHYGGQSGSPTTAATRDDARRAREAHLIGLTQGRWTGTVVCVINAAGAAILLPVSKLLPEPKRVWIRNRLSLNLALIPLLLRGASDRSRSGP